MRPIPGVRRAALDSLRERDFRLIWTVGILGEFGRRYELLALSLLILEVTDSSAAHLMLLWVFNNLPRPFVSNLAGYLADRFRRQRVIFLGQCVNLVSAAGLLGLMAYDLDSIQTWHIFVWSFSFRAPPRLSRIPRGAPEYSTLWGVTASSTPCPWTLSPRMWAKWWGR